MDGGGAVGTVGEASISEGMVGVAVTADTPAVPSGCVGAAVATGDVVGVAEGEGVSPPLQARAAVTRIVPTRAGRRVIAEARCLFTKSIR